jgi:hypothetical protein
MIPAFQISFFNRRLTLSEWSWILLFVMLPAGRPFTTYALIAVALTSVLSLRKNFSTEFLLSLKITWPLFLFFLLHLTGLLYTEDFDFAFKDLSVKLPIVLIPVLAGLSQQTAWFRNKALFAFSLSCVAVNFFLLVRAIYQHFSGVTGAFYYDVFSPFIHPAYMALMNTLAISILLLTHHTQSLLSKRILFFFSAFLSVCVFFMASKSGILSLLFVFSACIFKSLYQKNKLTAAFAFCAVILLSVLLIWLSPAQQRLRQSINVILHPETAIHQQESTAGRLLAWKTAWQISKDYFPWGTGTGDIKKVTLRFYEQAGYQWPLYYKLNAHNQFLQSLATIGLGGLLSLAFILLIPVIHRNQADVLPVLCTGLIFLNLLFESMLEVQNGVMLLSAFNSFLSFTASRQLKDV